MKECKEDIEVLHTSSSTEVDPADKIPYQDIVNLYHSECVSYPRLKSIGENRKKAISARWKQYKKNIKVFETLFKIAEESEFLKGANKRNWQADFNWLLNEANMAKILEGKYNKSRQANGAQFDDSTEQALEMLRREGLLDD